MILNLLFYLFLLASSYLSFEDQLHDYDVINSPKIRVKRSLVSTSQHLQLKSKYRNFNVILNPSDDIFTEDFKAVNVDEFGNKEEVFINRNNYYSGYVSGEADSSVKAFIDNDEMNLNIAIDNEIYQIEPISRYKSGNDSLLVYRYNDVKKSHSKSPKCKSMYVNDNSSSSKLKLSRSKREAKNPTTSSYKSLKYSQSNKKLCTIKLVADYRFNKKHSRGDKSRTHNYLIQLIDSINQIFKRTDFVGTSGIKYNGYGFVIKEILVHTKPTLDNKDHYNAYKPEQIDAWRIEHLLNTFSFNDFTDVCLAHLFTYQSFEGGTLGLAWIGTWKSVDNGGICSDRSYDSEHRREKSVNTGWSTYRDAAGNPLVSLSSILVTAHELGHNWGADHDSPEEECSPKSNKGGKYIMYTYSVVGYEDNNREFSPCSRSNIGATLDKRAETCFQSSPNKAHSSYCGNKRVELKEKCDVGSIRNDRCCTEQCNLRPNATCSPFNHECCTEDCQYKKKGYICYEADPLNPCLGNAICSGVNKFCSTPAKVSGTKCTEHGKCLNGECQPFCNQLGLVPCVCDDTSDSCKICCSSKSSSNGNDKNQNQCRPSNQFSKLNETLFLNDGRPCVQGFCQKGVCKKNVNKLIERIWKIIDKFDTNAFTAFLLDNLVGTVIFFSLILWIPASVIVRYHDIRHQQIISNERSFRH